MDPKALDDIHRFTASVDHADLFSYIDVERDADKNAITHALQVRRSWAQGQQANPKFRQEALWLIKNIELVKRALTAERSAYLQDLNARDERQNLETLSMFIKGTLADGDLTVRGEEAIQKQGETLGLPESVVIRRIGEILAERDAGTIGAPQAKSVVPALDIPDPEDLYAVLDADPEANAQELEEAYRRRYRWARQLRDTEKSSRIYSLLDEAWRVLQDPEKRKEYDAERTRPEVLEPDGANQSGEPNTPGDQIGFLPPPPSLKSLALPTPSVEKHLEAVLNEAAPPISMPTAQPERDAPPPPVIPPPGDEDPDYSVEVFEETEDGESPTSMEDFVTMGEDPSLEALEMDFGTAQSANEPTIKDLEASDTAGSPQNTGSSTNANAPEAPDIPLFGGFDLDSLDMGMSSDVNGELPSKQLDGPNLSGDLSGLDMGLMTPSKVSQNDGLTATKPEPVLSAGQLFNDMAELRVDGPKVIRIRTGVHPFPVRITVANAGEGTMPGTVSTDASWVQISPANLDPHRRRQVVEALVEPDSMPGNSAKAVITIETEHGEVDTVTIDALKYVISPVMLLVTALGVVGIGGLLAAAYFLGLIGSDLNTPTRTILAVNVDPPAGEVYIDEELVGNQGTLSLIDSFPIGTPFQIRVELDGFQPFAREVTVQRGDQLRIEADLALRDAVDFEPDPGMVEAQLDPDAIDAALESRQEHFDNCFTRNLRTSTPFTAEIEVTSTVTDRGFIHGIEFGSANFRSPAVEMCLKRQLRSLKLPLIPGDFARFERVMGTEIRPHTALNEGDEQ